MWYSWYGLRSERTVGENNLIRTSAHSNEHIIWISMKKDHERNLYSLKIPQLWLFKLKQEVGKQKEVLGPCNRRVLSSSLIPDPHKEIHMCVLVCKKERHCSKSHFDSRLLLVKDPFFETVVIVQILIGQPSSNIVFNYLWGWGSKAALCNHLLMWKCRPNLQLSDLSDGYTPLQYKSTEIPIEFTIYQRIGLLSLLQTHDKRTHKHLCFRLWLSSSSLCVSENQNYQSS